MLAPHQVTVKRVKVDGYPGIPYCDHSIGCHCWSTPMDDQQTNQPTAYFDHTQVNLSMKNGRCRQLCSFTSCLCQTLDPPNQNAAFHAKTMVPAPPTCSRGAKMAVNSPGKTHDSDMNKRHCHANYMCFNKKGNKNTWFWRPKTSIAGFFQSALKWW